MTCKSSSIEEKLSKEMVLGAPNVEGANSLRHIVNHFGVSKKPHRSFNLPRKLSGNNSAKMRVVGGIPANLGSNSFSTKPLKPRDMSLGKLQKNSSSLLNRNVTGSNLLKKDLVGNGSGSSKFLFALIDERGLLMHKSSRSLSRKEVRSGSEKANRLSHLGKLQLFEALLKEPLPFLGLHARFGVTKQTMRGFIRRGWLTEMWGPGGVGVKFRLSEEGRNYLRQLEAAAKYETKVTRKDFVRLKQKAFL